MRITKELFNEIVDEIQQYIPKLIDASGSIGELIYEPITTESNQLFSQYLTGMSNLVQSIMMTLEDAAEHTPAMVEPVTTALQAISLQVKEIEAALNEQNFVHVADILKFEMPNLLEVLLQAIKESR